jgi:negative regulator of flagellin synthesis FlgM
MKIDGSLRGTPLAGTGSNTAAARTKTNTAGSAKQDSVSLSDTSAQLNALETSVNQSSGFDTAKVDAIKQAISEGRFKINPERIADGLLSYSRDLVSQQ